MKDPYLYTKLIFTSSHMLWGVRVNLLTFVAKNCVTFWNTIEKSYLPNMGCGGDKTNITV